MKRKIYENMDMILIMIYIYIYHDILYYLKKFRASGINKLVAGESTDVFWQSFICWPSKIFWPSKRFRDWTHICDLLLVLVEEMLLSPLACAELTPEYFSKHASPWSQLRAFQWREFRNFGGFEMLRNFCKGRRAATNEADQGACPSCPSKRWIRAAKVHTSYAAGCITVCGPFLQVQRPLLPEITWGNQCILLLRK